MQLSLCGCIKEVAMVLGSIGMATLERWPMWCNFSGAYNK